MNRQPTIFEQPHREASAKKLDPQAAAARFFLRIDQAQASQPWRDGLTMPLFPLPLLMHSDGVLSRECDALLRTAA